MLFTGYLMFVKIYTIFIVFVEYVIIIWNIISIPIIKDMFFFTGYFAFISNQMKTWLEEFVSSYFIILAYYVHQNNEMEYLSTPQKTFSEFEAFQMIEFWKE